MCKLPAQDVMASEFGVPVYMAPNFETGGCRMFFGQEPLPESVDPAMRAVLGAVRRRGAILAETADGGGRDGSGRVPSGERVGRAGDAGAGVGQVWGVAGEGARVTSVVWRCSRFCTGTGVITQEWTVEFAMHRTGRGRTESDSLRINRPPVKERRFTECVSISM